MVLKLYGFPQSTATRLAALVLHEKKVPFEFIPFDRSKGDHKTKEYLEKHPFGVVPTTKDSSSTNHAPSRVHYRQIPYPGTQGLIPTDLKANALFEQAASIEFANFHSHALPAWVEGWGKKDLGLEPDQAAAQKHLAALDAKLEVYEQILGRQKYLLGMYEVTLADLFHLPFGSRIPLMNAKSIESRPNVSRWFNEISSRPAWVAVKDGVTSTA
ncbi:glutathione S-transferase [Cyathus striatus]|nr:glutathione S-transferase [Cyathus striatus]